MKKTKKQKNKEKTKVKGIEFKREIHIKRKSQRFIKRENLLSNWVYKIASYPQDVLVLRSKKRSSI